jgi:hypothetical protein
MAYNLMAAQAKEGNFDLFDDSMKDLNNPEYKAKRLSEVIAGDFRSVPESIPQVTLDQIKEKFGTLRFYYTGGDDVIDGMVRMAESMSGVTCETCGNPGQQRGGGWIRTLCDHHEELYQEGNRSREMKQSGLEE